MKFRAQLSWAWKKFYNLEAWWNAECQSTSLGVSNLQRVNIYCGVHKDAQTFSQKIQERNMWVVTWIRDDHEQLTAVFFGERWCSCVCSSSSIFFSGWGGSVQRQVRILATLPFNGLHCKNKHSIHKINRFSPAKVKKKTLSVKMWLFSYPSVLIFVWGFSNIPTHWDCSFEHPLWHNMFWSRKRKIVFNYTPLSQKPQAK